MSLSGLDVTLVHPAVPAESVFERLGRSDLPPLGILYVAASLERAGHRVRVVDLNLVGDGGDVVHQLLGPRPDVIGLGTLAPSLDATLSLARRLRECATDATKLIAGGADATIRTKLYVDAGLFDAVVVGEAEGSLVCLLDGWPGLDSTDGVLLPGETSIRRAAPVHPDDAPLPARHLLPLRGYRGGPAYKRSHHSTSIFTHRGCPYACSFCEQSVHGGPVRYRSAEGVLDEIRRIRTDHDIHDIRFIDDVFMANSAVLHEFLELVLSEGERFSWLTTGRVDLADRQTLIKMKRAGCYRIEYGIESGSDRLLAMTGKGFDVATAEQALRVTREAGIESIANFILGFPTETEDEIEQTIEMALRAESDFAIFFAFCPYEGAAICEEFGVRWDPHAPANRAPSPAYRVPTEQLLARIDEAYSRFYFRPGFAARRLAALRSSAVARDLAWMGALHLWKRARS